MVFRYKNINLYHDMNICHDMKCYYITLPRIKIQTNFYNFIDDQQPSSGSISVFLITINTLSIVFYLYVYHITILLPVTIYITILIYHGSTNIHNVYVTRFVKTRLNGAY